MAVRWGPQARTRRRAIDDLEPWEPLPLDELVELMRRIDTRWWIAGGHALELHLGRWWRAHDDIDVGVCRSEVPRLRDVFAGWEIFVASRGELRAWHGEPIAAARHENNLWVRHPGGPWRVDVTVGEDADGEWVYRRDPTFRLPWDRAVLRSLNDVPYLAPALQLLFKSKAVRPKDQLDAEAVIPHLDAGSLAVLDARLPRSHRWRTLVRNRRS